ncbi:hypothetical protein GCM10010430_72350 [Kitasatospora cystarginea]|uniref:D-inositol 3-phosphate glycosyltransferase n=1 Tax=Kitasatospora cystarginea TaxID=58350 RepID=A0ABP5RWL6_9ACTN
MPLSGTAIVIPYFNPVGYRSHPRKLARCLAAFDRAGVADQVFLTGAGTERPPGANIAFWDDECPFMWHKERLINLAARSLPPRFTRVVWVDSDVLVAADWGDAVADAFERAPVIQCFRRAHYSTSEGESSRSRVSSMHGRFDGIMGVAWGASRSLFTDGPGLFELALVGGGDSIFTWGLLHNVPTPNAPWRSRHRMVLDSWSPAVAAAHDRWLAELQRWLSGLGGVRPVAVEADVEILEHGPLHAREYDLRHGLLAELVPERHLRADGERVFSWTPAGLAAIEPGIRDYFHRRREDDPSEKAVVAIGGPGGDDGLGVLVDAWAKVSPFRPDWRLKIYAAGPPEAALGARWIGLGLAGTIDWMGQSADATSALRNCAVFARTSCGAEFPLELLQAMSCSVPCVAVACGAELRELIHDGEDGLLARPGDGSGLARQLGRLMDDGQLRRAMGDRARRSAQRYVRRGSAT